MTRPLAAGFVALAIAATLPGCASSSTTRPTATAASLEIDRSLTDRFRRDG